MSTKLRLGTRASALALTQSRMVAGWVESAARTMGIEINVELVEISTHGDQDRTSALKEFGGVGVFVKELEQALLENRVDFAVHSLKDMPIKQPDGLRIAAIPEREDVRDVLIVRRDIPTDLSQWKPEWTLATGSPRRRAQLALLNPKLKFAEMRGNVETRLRKIAHGEFAGTLLAIAGLKRLGYYERLQSGVGTVKPELELIMKALQIRVLNADEMLPAPGQGALGIECRTSDAYILEILGALNHKASSAGVTIERQCLERLGGGCHLPLGTYAQATSNGYKLSAILAMPDGSHSCRVELESKNADTLGVEVAERILNSADGQQMIAKLNLKGI